MSERSRATNVGMAVAYWAREAPDRLAVASQQGDFTFAELNGRANQLVRALRERGLRAGDAVALMSRNRPEWVETWAATLRAGWRLTPVNWHLTADEAAYVVEDCEAKALIADASLGDHVPNTNGVRLMVGADYDDVVGGEDRSDIDDPVLGNTMMYTSGTTGRPKGVSRQPTPPLIEKRYRGEDHRNLCTGPLYHGGPYAVSLVPPLTNGVGTVLMDKWDPEETLRLIEEQRITHSHMVPTMFHRLLALPDPVKEKYDLSSLRYVIHGAAPCPVEVKRRIIEWWGPVIFEYYSSTEGFACVVDSKTWLERPGTVGQPGELCYVGDDDALPVPPGSEGLLWIKAAEHPFHYFKDDDKTAKAYRGNYFSLGDVGYMDADGYLYLTDRSANLIISGGVNIYPAEVDAVLLGHPAVADVATIGVPNDEWGEEVRAVVQLVEGAERRGELALELIEFCRARLAHYKCPRAVDFVDDLPREDSGKIYKRRLRELYRTGARTTASSAASDPA